MMVVGKDDLGLSLSLGCANNNTTTTTPTNATTSTSIVHNNNNNYIHNNNGFIMNRNHVHQTTSLNTTPTTPIQLNLMMMSSTTPGGGLLQKLPWNPSTDSFPPTSSDRLFLRGIDVNRPAAGGDEEDVGVSSPNSTVSTVSGKRSSGDRDSGAGDDHEFERESGAGISDDDDGGENCRKKLRLSKDQSAVLEESFKEHNTLNPKQKLALAKRLGLRPRQVEVWFQNRRARTKLKQTEVDCEFLKRCCEQLTEENRRLQKEVQELRALKLSPQFYMQMTPPTTLTMCPSCERVATPQSTTTSATLPTVAHHHHRRTPVNPWAAAPVPIRPFEALQPRSS